MFSLLSNTLPALHALHRAESSLATSFQRLATGLRINSAKDDPAGLIAATHLSSEITSVQSQRKSDQMDYYKALVADGAYAADSDLMQNALSLLLQSQAGPSVTSSDTDSLQSQLDHLFQGVDRLASILTLDGFQLLSGSTHLGANSTLFTLNRTDTTTLGSYTPPNDPAQPTYTLADLATGGRLSLNNPTAPLPPDQRALLAQKVLDSAVSQLAAQRADVGSFMRYSINSFGNVLDNQEANLSNALSQIQDTDYAAEISNYVRQKSMVDINTALLAFGVQQQSQVLALLAPVPSR